MTTPLTWGLTIATYNRADCLRTCVALAVAQTRPPSEVVIVDASDDWSKARDTILSEIAADNPAVRWTYQQARVRSLTHQRNQALDQTTADVLFLIDDDSFMFDDCAAEIMAIYEADPEGKIAGVSATLADNAPGASSSPAREPVWRSALRRPTQAVAEAFNRFYADELILPYDDEYPDCDIPASVAGTGARRCRRIHGMCMTYRRDAVRKERFTESLTRYAAGEDLDASYRISRHGALVVAPRAKLFHAQSSAARLSRYTRVMLGLTNFAFLYRIYGKRPHALVKRLRRGIYRRMFFDVITDLGRLRWTVPRLRADVDALRIFPRIENMERSALDEWYPQFQTGLIDRNPS